MNEKISTVTLTLKSNEETLLFILLSRDGTINRLGTGSTNDHNFFIGIDQDSMFENFIKLVDEEDLKHTGRYHLPAPKGDLCILTIVFQMVTETNERSQTGFEFTYGSKSQGPPSPIRKLVLSAIEITNPWYERQQQMAKNNKKT